VTVGRVAKISLDGKTFQGVVTMELEQRFRLSEGHSASILTAGLLGDQYVGLNPGGEDDNLAAGDTIKLTQSAVVLENLIGRCSTTAPPKAAARQRSEAAVSALRALCRLLLAFVLAGGLAACASIPSGAGTNTGRPLEVYNRHMST